MNTVFHTLGVGLLALATTAAATQPPVTAGQRVEIIAPDEAIAAAQTVLSIRNLDAAYRMSTGRRLDVSNDGDTLRVRYGRRTAKTLRHDGQGSFVSHDGMLALRFELDRHGDPQTVRLTLPATWL
jgi:hypothetical protein